MPYCDPRVFPGEKNQRVYNDFIYTFATFVSALKEERYSVTLFGTDIGVDGLAIEDLRRVVRDHYGVTLPGPPLISSVDEVLNAISEMDYIVTCRFHGVVFAHLLNKPVLALSHHPKVTTLMADIGLSPYCIDIDHLNPQRLVESFTRLCENDKKIKALMATRAAEYKLQVTVQFDDLFPQGLPLSTPATPTHLCTPAKSANQFSG
jgi:hypothetical protein